MSPASGELAGRLARHLRGVYFGGNWTDVNLRDALADITWQEAARRLSPLHSIAEFVFHLTYFVQAQRQVLEQGRLEASDKFSFNAPAIATAIDWERLRDKAMVEAETLAGLIERLPDEQIRERFIDPEYGDYYFNFQGLVEHCHYHLGQIVSIKKMLRSEWLA